MRAALLVCLGTLGCAASETRHQVVAAIERGAYADALRTYEKGGQERSLLRVLAESVLLQDAQLADGPRQRSAFGELELLGTRARPWLERLARPEQPESVRARALRILMVLGDSDARAQLRELAFTADPAVVDEAFAALDPSLDQALLLSTLRAPRAARRLAAVVLLGAADAPNTLQPIVELSRSDPEPSVRAAALFALERRGAEAVRAFERGLKDDSESVRVAAIAAFARAAPAQALSHLDQQLGSAVSHETLAAAVALLQMQPVCEAARAHDALARGLAASESPLRSHTAVLIRTLPGDRESLAAVRERLAIESVPEVQLALALALGADDPAARRALARLAQGTALVAAQAAQELARFGDATAERQLITLRASASSVTRASVARALGRDRRVPEAVAPLLADQDPSVRIAAAGAILAALMDPSNSMQASRYARSAVTERPLSQPRVLR